MIGYLARNHPLIHAFAQGAPVRRTRRETLAANRIFKLAPKLADCFHEEEILAVKGRLDRPISGLAIDPRRILPGALFFALPDGPADGAGFIDEAVSRGAVAVVVEAMPAHRPGKATFIEVADARVALALVARRYYGFPDRDLNVVGVTGKQGKTVVTHLVKHFLNGDQRVGLLGAINYDLGGRTVPSFRATPEAPDIYGMMAQMRDAGCRHAVMEVSSSGIERRQVFGLQFGAAVFTDFSPEQPDGSETVDGSCAMKMWLFDGGTSATPQIAVVNLDDPQGVRLAEKLRTDRPAVRLVTYGENPAAHVRADNVGLHSDHTSLRLVWSGGNCGIESPLIGRQNVSHLLAAVATAWGLGRDPVVFLARLRAFKGVPGRMERIVEGQAFNVIVDHARTAGSLRHALGVLRPITPGRLLVVFGCGGNRDRTMRPLMTGAVQELADFAFATADNPRTEAMAQIFEDMRRGVTAPGKITWIEDRRRAIGLAFDMAKPGDCLLIAGKGHEGCQEHADTVFPFDDRQVVRELIENKTRWPQTQS